MFEFSEHGNSEDNNCSRHEVSLHEHLNQQLNDLYTHPENGQFSIL